MAVQSGVATASAREIQVQLSGTEQYELARSRSVVPEAYEVYLRGRYEAEKRTPEGFLAAAEFYKKVTRKEDSFALAWAGLANAYRNISNYQLQPAGVMMPKAKQAAQKALELDDRLGEAYTSMAAIRFYHLEDGDIEGEFQKAIPPNPGYATAPHRYALFVAARGRRA